MPVDIEARLAAIRDSVKTAPVKPRKRRADFDDEPVKRPAAGHTCGFCCTNPPRHDLCPVTIQHDRGQVWTCDCQGKGHRTP